MLSMFSYVGHRENTTLILVASKVVVPLRLFPGACGEKDGKVQQTVPGRDDNK